MPTGKIRAAAQIGKAVAKVAIERTAKTGKPTLDTEALLGDPNVERQGDQEGKGKDEPRKPG